MIEDLSSKYVEITSNVKESNSEDIKTTVRKFLNFRISKIYNKSFDMHMKETEKHVHKHNVKSQVKNTNEKYSIQQEDDSDYSVDSDCSCKEDPFQITQQSSKSTKNLKDDMI